MNTKKEDGLCGFGPSRSWLLSGDYSDLGPAKTVINFNAGTVTFNATKPITSTVTCTPKSPLEVISKVTE